MSKQKTAMNKIAEIEKSQNYQRIAFWLLLAMVVMNAVVIYSVQKGLWTAYDSMSNTVYRQDVKKLPCSSNINSNCINYRK